jgi:hypothetical protein
MAQSMPVLQKTFKAAGDLSALQFTYVKFSADYTVTGAGAGLGTEGDIPIGILQNAPAVAGLGAMVRLLGTSKLKVNGSVGGGISAGSLLKITAGGIGIVAADAKDVIVAQALEASSANGDIIEVMMLQPIFMNV